MIPCRLPPQHEPSCWSGKVFWALLAVRAGPATSCPLACHVVWRGVCKNNIYKFAKCLWMFLSSFAKHCANMLRSNMNLAHTILRTSCLVTCKSGRICAAWAEHDATVALKTGPAHRRNVCSSLRRNSLTSGSRSHTFAKPVSVNCGFRGIASTIFVRPSSLSQNLQWIYKLSKQEEQWHRE